MIEAFVCFGIYCFLLFVIFLLLFEGEDAKRVKYYTEKMKFKIGKENEKRVRCGKFALAIGE